MARKKFNGDEEDVNDEEDDLEAEDETEGEGDPNEEERGKSQDKSAQSWAVR